MIEERTAPVEDKRPRKKTVDKQKFVNRKLAVINNMADQAKAKALAERVLRNR